METSKDGKIHPDVALTRAQASMLLGAAYGIASLPGTFGPNPSKLKSSFADVPLYAEESASVEALHDLGALPAVPAAGDRFHPNELIFRADFLRLVEFLEGKKLAPIHDAMLRGNMRPERDGPITRGGELRRFYTQPSSTA